MKFVQHALESLYLNVDPASMDITWMAILVRIATLIVFFVLEELNMNA